MAFDAGMLACTLHEIRTVALGGRIEKVMQPEKDEIVLQMRTLEGGRRLLIRTGSNPRIGFSSAPRENPPQAPMFCMLLRKHLTGAKLAAVEQAGFERVAILTFDTRDEMGFACRRFLIVEIMGKYSNLIFAGEPTAAEPAPHEGYKIISALRTVDFSTSSKRQILPGMAYELPPAQDKENPLTVSKDTFSALWGSAMADQPLDKFISGRFCGISAAVAREIAHMAASASGRAADQSPTVGDVTEAAAFAALNRIMDRVRDGVYEPTLILDGRSPVEYAFCPLTHYTGFESQAFPSAGEMMDVCFESRDRDSRLRQRAADILRLLTQADNRLRKKLEAQRAELKDCERAGIYKKYGDLITANLYALERGMSEAELVDYEEWNEETESYGTCLIALDERMTPSGNAQAYYKKYAKARNAKVELTRQIEIAERELGYIDSVFDSLTHAETSADLLEIRDELYRSGYASRMKGYAAPKKASAPTVAKFRTSGGFRVLCGKNNLQNEHITHKVAEKNDYWFHAKGVPGSHVVMITEGREPSEQDFTEAAMIAAVYSKAGDGHQVAVDYLLARHVKKVPGSKPGFVVYHTNWSAWVTPDEKVVAALREK